MAGSSPSLGANPEGQRRDRPGIVVPDSSDGSTLLATTILGASSTAMAQRAGDGTGIAKSRQSLRLKRRPTPIGQVAQRLALTSGPRNFSRPIGT